ncbi:MAG: type II toxin-antitoxin system death-on-curing family toxin [Parachlamydiales bacterium]
MTKYLTSKHVIALHDKLLIEFGGLKGIRDKNLLHSALEAPKMSFGGSEMYPSIYDKAAVYLYHLAKNHPFNDGNKRTAYVAALVFLQVNNAPIKFKIKRLEQLVVEVANKKINKDELSYFFHTGIYPDT